uniref:TonB-dependent receptor n=1 Tax=Parastrongyloides trichosuri TaxID=131310 RepID=A0A0N4Z2Z5_PARTI
MLDKKTNILLAMAGAAVLMASSPVLAQDAAPAAPAAASAPAAADAAAPAADAAAPAADAAAEAPAEEAAADGHGGAGLTPIAMFMMAHPVVKVVMAGLILASIFSWTLLLIKLVEFSSLTKKTNRFLEEYRGARNLADIRRLATSEEFDGNPLADMAAAATGEIELSRQAGLDVTGAHRDTTVSRANNAVGAVQGGMGIRLSGGQQFLASVGSGGPFVAPRPSARCTQEEETLDGCNGRDRRFGDRPRSGRHLPVQEQVRTPGVQLCGRGRGRGADGGPASAASASAAAAAAGYASAAEASGARAGRQHPGASASGDLADRADEEGRPRRIHGPARDRPRSSASAGAARAAASFGPGPQSAGLHRRRRVGPAVAGGLGRDAADAEGVEQHGPERTGAPGGRPHRPGGQSDQSPLGICGVRRRHAERLRPAVGPYGGDDGTAGHRQERRPTGGRDRP